jgi:phospholipase C
MSYEYLETKIPDFVRDKPKVTYPHIIWVKIDQSKHIQLIEFLEREFGPKNELWRCQAICEHTREWYHAIVNKFGNNLPHSTVLKKLPVKFQFKDDAFKFRLMWWE